MIKLIVSIAISLAIVITCVCCRDEEERERDRKHLVLYILKGIICFIFGVWIINIGISNFDF